MAMTNAERQKAFRDRRKALHGVDAWGAREAMLRAATAAHINEHGEDGAALVAEQSFAEFGRMVVSAAGDCLGIILSDEDEDTKAAWHAINAIFSLPTAEDERQRLAATQAEIDARMARRAKREKRAK